MSFFADILPILLIVGAWLVLQLVILPRMGVSG
jgi:hypothetical protein